MSFSFSENAATKASKSDSSSKSVDLLMSQLRVVSLLYSNTFPMKEVAGLYAQKPSEKDVKAVKKALVTPSATAAVVLDLSKPPVAPSAPCLATK